MDKEPGGTPARLPGRYFISMVLWVFVATFGFQWYAQRIAYRHAFLTEFGYPSGESGPELAIPSRLEALCVEYQAAMERAEVHRQKFMPGKTPGSEAEREQFILDAIERLTKEKAEQAREHFNFSRQLAESVGPLPPLSSCHELIPEKP